MTRAQLLIDLVEVPRPAGMPTGLPFPDLHRPACHRELAATTWTRDELPGRGWVVQADADDATLAALEAVPGVTPVARGERTEPVRARDRAAVVSWLARRGVQVTARDLQGKTIADVVAEARRGTAEVRRRG